MTGSTSPGVRRPTTSASPATRSSAARAPAAPTSPRSRPRPAPATGHAGRRRHHLQLSRPRHRRREQPRPLHRHRHRHHPSPRHAAADEPGTLTATAAAGEIDLCWGASTDDVGVTGYQVERCQGADCTDFAPDRYPHRHQLPGHERRSRHQLQLPRPRHRRRRQHGPLLEHRDRHHTAGDHDRPRPAARRSDGTVPRRPERQAVPDHRRLAPGADRRPDRVRRRALLLDAQGAGLQHRLDQPALQQLHGLSCGREDLGRVPPFTTPGDLSTPNEAYFARVDRMIQLAAQYGFVVLLDPAETGGWLDTLVANGVDKDRAYGQYLGRRYEASRTSSG